MTVLINVIILAFALIKSNLAGPRDTLLSLIQVYRHGERTPVAFYPTDPYQDFSFWNLSEGLLTNIGKQEHYDLGQYTRRRYSNFISKYYSRDDFLVQTTNYDRTYMSAASNVAGLFPPVGYQVWKKDLDWQPIPIFPVEPALLNDFSACARLAAVSSEVANSEYFLKIDEGNRDLYEYLSIHSGSNVTTLIEALLIWDALYIEARQNFKLPSWTKSVYPQPLTHLTGIALEAYSFTEEQKILGTGPFLNEVITRFEKYLTNSSSTQKYLQFSGHDINIKTILDSLGAPISYVPNFASTIFFELWEKRGEHYINVYHKNEDVAEPVTVKGCNFDCDLKKFKKILSKITISIPEWYAACEA